MTIATASFGDGDKFYNHVHIVLNYAEQQDDFHFSSVNWLLELPEGCESEAYIRRVMAAAKDMGIERDPKVELCPVYERAGWWTTRPTYEVRLISQYRALLRNSTEQERNARISRAFSRGGKRNLLPAIIKRAADNIKVDVRLLEANLPDPNRRDRCLARIDEKIEGMAA